MFTVVNTSRVSGPTTNVRYRLINLIIARKHIVMYFLTFVFMFVCNAILPYDQCYLIPASQ